jgi:hypothetical protein
MFEGMEAKEKERQWLKNQQTGDLDDNRLVDGATGERNVYKRRGTFVACASSGSFWCDHGVALIMLVIARSSMLSPYTRHKSAAVWTASEEPQATSVLLRL